MSVALRREGVAVDGAGIVVAEVDLRDRGPARAYVKNIGAQALGAAEVRTGPSGGDETPIIVDDTTFAALPAGAMAQVRLATPPLGLVRVIADEGGDGPTTVNVTIATHHDGRGEDRG